MQGQRTLTRMWNVLRAAWLYFLAVFAAGFVLGTIRTLWLEPALGQLPAVLAELPVMLLWSWAACGIILRRLPVAGGIVPRLAMGTMALVVLLAAEAALSVTLGGLTLAQHVALYATAPVLAGLAGQLAFALFPLLRR
jgi:hypothetical protein